MPFAKLENREVLTVAGSEAETFLQGLVSNDVSVAAQGQAVWAALLTPQGKYKHDFFVFKDQDMFLLEGEGGERLLDLGRTLRRFVLRSDVTLGIKKDVSTFVAWGQEANEFWQNTMVLPFADGHAFRDPRLAEMGARIIGSELSVISKLARTGFEQVAADQWHAHRIALGVPDGSYDLDIEKSILLEAGFDELNGVDWVKGCYMGQELTARTKYRGLIKRRLVPVDVEGNGVEPGDDVMVENRVVGSVKSVASAGTAALANLRLDAIFGDAGPLTTDTAVLTPRPPAWLVVPSKG